MGLSTTRIAVLGLYRSGSTALAGVLHHLGADMGAPFFRDYFEPEDLSSQLRRWWNEPELEEKTPKSERVRAFADWIRHREATGPARAAGCKHPLLSLCGDDLLAAWGADTRFVWSHRPLEESILSLIRLNWWPNGEDVQRKLWKAVNKFVANQEHLRVEYADMLADPRRQVAKIIEYLRLAPTEEQVSAAVQSIRPRSRSSTSNQRMGSAVVRSGRRVEGNGKIVATMLSGNAQEMVADAARSVVELVDEFLLIDTGISDETINVVQEIAGSKLAHVKFPWINDFAAARNAALRFAAERGATWALTIDTDERLSANGISSSQEMLSHLEADSGIETWMVSVRDGSYAKERFIRVPTSLEWRGRTHEALCGAELTQRRVLPNVTFWELAKSKEAFRRKLERDLVILREETAKTPDNGRWWYYLGQTLESLGEHGQAVEAFQRCAMVDGWAEQAAWACYMAAKSLCQVHDFQEALNVCAQGLVKQPGSPELAWLAGWCCFKMGADRDAIVWSQIAISLGNVAGIRAGEYRIGFRHLPGWYEAPYDVMRFAYRRLGDHAAADEAERQFHRAQQLRFDRGKSGPGQDAERVRNDNGRVASGNGQKTDAQDGVAKNGSSQVKRVLFDLGAHHGVALRRLARELTIDSTWDVHVFEPNPACEIRERLSDLDFPIEIHESAAWVHDGTIAFRQQNHLVARNHSPTDGRSELDGWGSCIAGLESSHPALEDAIKVTCQDVANLLERYSENDFVVMKMDVEGAEFVILRHLIQRGVISRIKRLYVEWHERLLEYESTATRQDLEQEIRAHGVEIRFWG